MAATKKKITRERFEEIKPQLKLPTDDPIVMAKYNLSKSTIQKIRNTETYDEYCERTFRYHGHPGGRSKKKAKQAALDTPPLLDKPQDGTTKDGKLVYISLPNPCTDDTARMNCEERFGRAGLWFFLGALMGLLLGLNIGR